MKSEQQSVVTFSHVLHIVALDYLHAVRSMQLTHSHWKTVAHYTAHEAI